VSRYSKHVESTCVEYNLFQKIHINDKQNKYSHTREINRIVIPWIHPRDNYPFQLDYNFHGRGKLSKR
jgi:Cu2+-containing amine oxidase